MAQAGRDGEADAFVRSFATIGVMSFGGPAGQIATLHRELVERRAWIDDATFLKALNFCMLLPGPEAHQLATWCGWRLRGVRGGLVAGLLFVTPGAVVMAALVALYIGFGRVAGVQAAFAGVQAAVVAVVAGAVWRVGRRSLGDRHGVALALAAFLAITLLNAPFPLVVVLAGLAGALRRRDAVVAPAAGAIDWRGSARTAAMWAAIWLAPLLVLALVLGPDHGLVALGAFFARLAAVSFGGAYAGLAYVAQAAVASGWVTPAEIVDGLALAETTPGPLVLVYQFVGGLAGFHIGGWGMAAAAMALVLWMSFGLSFLMIFTLAPHLERLLARPGLSNALAGVTAAVVGVMASLGLWFALHVLFGAVVVERHGIVQVWRPVGLDKFAVILAGAALAALPRLGLLPVLGLAMLAGLARWWLNIS